LETELTFANPGYKLKKTSVITHLFETNNLFIFVFHSVKTKKV